MTELATERRVPSSILVATDLSCRCDRAQDRAVMAAREWNARLVVLTVIDPSHAAAVRQRYAGVPSWWSIPDLQTQTERRLRAEMPTDVNAVVRVVEGPVVDTILRVAEDERCGLVITGIAKDEPFGSVVIGSTVDALVRRATIPVLAVRRRPLGPYRRITVATDFSPASRRALEAAIELFPGSEVSLFHAFDVPFAGMAGGGNQETLIDAQRAAAARECEAFLDGSNLPPIARQRLNVVLEYGAPERLLNQYVAETGVDLIALGSHGRGVLFNLVFGSVAKRIMEMASVDVLAVREPPAPGA